VLALSARGVPKYLNDRGELGLGAQVEQVLQYRDRQNEYDDDAREWDEVTNVQGHGPVENLAESQGTKLHPGAFLQADSNPLPRWEPAGQAKIRGDPGRAAR
jgi:hypothetical protein